MGNANSRDGALPQPPDFPFPRSSDSPSPLGVVGMIADPPLASPNANVVSRYQQISRHIVAAASGAGGASCIPTIHANGDVCSRPSESSRTISPVGLMPDSCCTEYAPQTTTKQVPVCAKAPEIGLSYTHIDDTMLVDESENTIPTLIEWKHGGSNVSVEGSWDGWNSRIALQKSGKDFTLVKFLAEGVYHYKFVIDGESKYAADLPYVEDIRGNVMNILDVQRYIPESLDGLTDFEAPPSPDSSYDNSFPGPEDYTKDPPILPSQVHFNPELECLHTSPYSSAGPSMRPDHVILNHLFVESRKGVRSPILTLGFTQRFRSKYVTVILHKPSRG